MQIHFGGERLAAHSPCLQGKMSSLTTAPVVRAKAGDIDSPQPGNCCLKRIKPRFLRVLYWRSSDIFSHRGIIFQETCVYYSSLCCPHHVSNANQCLAACHLCFITSFKPYWSECSSSAQETPGYPTLLLAFARHVRLHTL